MSIFFRTVSHTRVSLARFPGRRLSYSFRVHREEQGHLRGLEDGQDREGFPVARERDDLQVCRPFHRTSNMTSL